MAITYVKPFNYGGGEWQMAAASVINTIGNEFVAKIEKTKQQDALRYNQSFQMLQELDDSDLIYKDVRDVAAKEIAQIENRLTEMHQSRETGLFKPKISDEEFIELSSMVKRGQQKINKLKLNEQAVNKQKEAYSKEQYKYDPIAFQLGMAGFLEDPSGDVGNFLIPAATNIAAALPGLKIAENEYVKTETFNDKTNEIETKYEIPDERKEGLLFSTVYSAPESMKGVVDYWIANGSPEDVLPQEAMNEIKKSGKQMTVGDIMQFIPDIMEAEANGDVTIPDDKKRVMQLLQQYQMRQGNVAGAPEDLVNIAYFKSKDELKQLFGQAKVEKKPDMPSIRADKKAARDAANEEDTNELTYSVRDNVEGVNGKQGTAVTINKTKPVKVPSNVLEGVSAENIGSDSFLDFVPVNVFKDGTVQGIVKKIPQTEKTLSSEEYEQISSEIGISGSAYEKAVVKREMKPETYIVDGTEYTKKELLAIPESTVSQDQKEKAIKRGGKGKIVRINTRDMFSVKRADDSFEYKLIIPEQENVSVELTTKDLLDYGKSELKGLEDILNQNDFQLNKGETISKEEFALMTPLEREKFVNNGGKIK